MYIIFMYMSIARPGVAELHGELQGLPGGARPGLPMKKRPGLGGARLGLARSAAAAALGRAGVASPAPTLAPVELRASFGPGDQGGWRSVGNIGGPPPPRARAASTTLILIIIIITTMIITITITITTI